MNLPRENLNKFKYSSLQSAIDAARHYEEHRPNNINSVNARPANTHQAEQLNVGLWKPKALYHQSQNGINVIHSSETTCPERSTLRPKSHIVAQPSVPGSQNSGFPGKGSEQSFSQSCNFVSQAGKFKQSLAPRNVSS